MIEIRGLHKSFGALKVLQGVDLQIPKGKITVIVGRSGVGKSVLLKHLIGLIRPDRGRIWIDGVDVTQLGERELNELRKKFGMLFQEAALFDSLNVGENVAFPLREHTKLGEKDVRQIVDQKLEQVGLRLQGGARSGPQRRQVRRHGPRRVRPHRAQADRASATGSSTSVPIRRRRRAPPRRI